MIMIKVPEGLYYMFFNFSDEIWSENEKSDEYVYISVYV